MMHNKIENRILFIDIARGIGMVLVVIGHIVDSKNTLGIFISSFHMPLFFFLSGYCRKEDSQKIFSSKISRKINSLIFPCIIMYIIIKIVDYLLLNISGINFRNLPDTLWFLPVLFITDIIGNMAIKINKAVYPALIIAIITQAYINSYILLPFSFNAITASTVFYLIGYKFKQMNIFDYIPKYIAISFIGFLILYICAHLRISNVILVANKMDPQYVAYPLAILGIISCINTSMLLAKYKPNILIYISKHSLVIMGFHMLFIRLSSQIIKPLFLENINTNYIIYKIIEICIITLLCLIAIKIKNIFHYYIPAIRTKFIYFLSQN